MMGVTKISETTGASKERSPLQAIFGISKPPKKHTSNRKRTRGRLSRTTKPPKKQTPKKSLLGDFFDKPKAPKKPRKKSTGDKESAFGGFFSGPSKAGKKSKKTTGKKARSSWFDPPRRSKKSSKRSSADPWF